MNRNKELFEKPYTKSDIIKIVLLKSSVFFFSLFIIFYSVWIYYMNKDKIVIIPDLNKTNLEIAKKKLNDLNLKYDIVYEYSSNVVKDNIIKQLPDPNRKIKEGRQITLFVSKGPQLINLPDVRNLPLDKAIKVLTKLTEGTNKNLNIVSKTKVYSNDIPAGYVISQTPGPGNLITPEDKINLMISKGPEPKIVYLPNLKNKNLEIAKKILNEIGLKYETIPLYNKNKPDRIILKQTPSAESEVNAEETIKLYYNQKHIKPTNLKSKLIVINYTVPHFLLDKRVKIKVIDMLGEHIIYNKLTEPATTLFLQTKIVGKAKMIVYIDGRLKTIRKLK